MTRPRPIDRETPTAAIDTVRIEPRRAFVALDLHELWSYRELLYFLTWRDIKIRYKQTLIGVFWAVLQPVLTTAVFTIIFSRFARFDTGDVPYPIFALCGLTIWLFTYSAVTIASSSFVNNTNLVTKIYFPRLIVPMAATLAGFFDLLFGLGVLVLMMAYYRTPVSVYLLAAPLFVILALIQAAAFGSLLSALTVKYRDVKFAVPFMLQIWMIASPIFYPVGLLTGNWRFVFALNPLTGIIDGFRSSIFGMPFNWDLILVSAASLALVLVASLGIFKKMEDEFADVI